MASLVSIHRQHEHAFFNRFHVMRDPGAKRGKVTGWHVDSRSSRRQANAADEHLHRDAARSNMLVPSRTGFHGDKQDPQCRKRYQSSRGAARDWKRLGLKRSNFSCQVKRESLTGRRIALRPIRSSLEVTHSDFDATPTCDAPFCQWLRT